MNFIKKMNKFGHKVPLEKTELYKEIEEYKDELNQMNAKVSIKDEFDMFDYEILMRSRKNQKSIDETYEMFYSLNQDALEYVSYEQRRKMFVSDLEFALKKLSFFEYNNQKIYIPHLEPRMNERYIHDYEMLLLKQHQEYLKNYSVNKKTIISLYGNRVYRTDFSSLEVVYEDNRHICLYYDEMHTIYIFQKETEKLLNKIIIKDHKDDEETSISQVKEIASFVEEYKYKECLDYMHENHFIGEKTYKKMSKKYK